MKGPGQRRVLVVSSTFPQFEGDARGAFIRHHWERAAEGGAEVRVLAPLNVDVRGQLEGRLQVDRVRYAPRRLSSLAGSHGILENVREARWRATLAPGFVYAQCRAIERALASFRPELVAAHFLLPSGWAAAATLTRSRRAPRLWMYGHGTDVDLVCALPRALRRRFRIHALAADRVMLPSIAKRSALVEALGLEGTPGHFEVERMSHAVVLAEAERPQPAVRRPYVLFLGRLIPQKGIEALLEACARAGVRVIVAGAGPLESRLPRLIRRLDVDAELVGWVTGAHKTELIAGAAAVCVPSREVRWQGEGAPLVVAEAHALGRPVLASRLPGVVELVEQLGARATLLPAGDTQAWVRALKRVLDHEPVEASARGDSSSVDSASGA